MMGEEDLALLVQTLSPLCAGTAMIYTAWVLILTCRRLSGCTGIRKYSYIVHHGASSGPTKGRFGKGCLALRR